MDQMDQVNKLHIEKFLIKLSEYAEKIKIIMVKEELGDHVSNHKYLIFDEVEIKR